MSKRFLLLCVSLASLWYPANSKRHSPPSILKQPPTDELLFQVATQQTENDKPFIIECEADGEPTPTYRWIKNGKPFSWQAYDDRISQQPGRGTLVITKPKNEDLGQYQCFAENEWGTATSNSVFVRKAELNSFKDEPPTTLVAREGDPFKLTCHPPDGWPKPNVYWLIQNTDGGIKSINSSRMTLDPEGNLWFSNVTRQDASDDFTYSCTAMSVFRNEYKLGNKVVLSVIPTGSSPGQNRHAPVQQYVSRKQEVALRDKKVQLYCIFGGTPLPQTVWFKDGRPLQFSDRISQGNYGKSLVIKHVTYEDEGDYTCEASNGVGDAKSYSINLRVMAIPFFIEEPEIVNAAEGEVATFRCRASGNPEPQIQWIYNGKPISEAPPNPRRRITANSVVIENLERSDTANYGCNATNSLGYVYKDVYLNVLAVAPEIVEMSPDEETVDNHNVTLMCRVSGVPKPQIKWIRNGVELTGGRYTVLDNGDLHISNVGFTDMGRYTCDARNKLGAVDMAVNLTVKQRTQIPSDLGPVDYEVQAGSPATFHCSPVKDDSLELTVEWLRNGEVINFESEPRYIRSNDYSLTITKTTELDSGIYTCLASTRLDEARAQATLIVQDVPNAPKLVGVICNAKDASVTWQPMGDNRAPILNYVIQYNTSFSPDLWDDAVESVPAAESSYNVPMSPWANYTFRVMARNKIGVSLPSPHSSVCRTDPDLPYKNPDNVEARGTKPDNLIIRWTPMSEIEHNAPRFHYQVSWKRDVPGSSWTVQDVPDWRTGMLEVNNQPTFQRYLVKVVAINEKGQANVAPAIVLGYSGENVPTEPPSNLTLIGKPTATGAHISWLPVSPDSLRGHFKGYKIQTWVEGEKEKGAKFMEVGNDTTEADINMLVPYTKNYVRVVAFNSAYNGPPSEVLVIETPEGVPGPVQSLDAIPLANSAFYLMWKPPLQPNGILTGYRIYYQTVTGTELGPLLERKPLIMDSAATGAKLAGLEPGTKYRIHLNATTVAGIGSGFWIERYTRGSLEMQPNPPAFTWSRVEQSEIFASLKIVWIPDEKKPGAHFYVKYRMKGHPEFIQTEPVLNEIHTIVGGLTPGYIYEFLVVSVDGVYTAESEPEEIDIYMPDAVLMTRESFFTAGWFVGMILAIAVLTIILILVCLVRRNRGGKYAVHEQEIMHRRQDFPDEPAFHEYSQPLSNAQRGLQRQESKPVESDSDSMAEYGDGETEGMNEDGSFIGLYGKQRRPDGGSTSFATVV